MLDAVEETQPANSQVAEAHRNALAETQPANSQIAEANRVEWARDAMAAGTGPQPECAQHEWIRKGNNSRKAAEVVRCSMCSATRGRGTYYWRCSCCEKKVCGQCHESLGGWGQAAAERCSFGGAGSCGGGCRAGGSGGGTICSQETHPVRGCEQYIDFALGR